MLKGRVQLGWWRMPVDNIRRSYRAMLVHGVVSKKPRLAKKRWVFFFVDIQHPDDPERKLTISVCTTELGLRDACYENLDVGTNVVVWGMRWLPSWRPKFSVPPAEPGKLPVFCRLIDIATDYPVRLDLNPQYVQVRYDLWSRIGAILEPTDVKRVPRHLRAELLERFAHLAGSGDTDSP